jgi:phosphatidylserine synthase
LWHEGGVSHYLLWPATLFYAFAGAFRLARFNLLPVKIGQTESVGLTISTAGATLTLAVLSDLANPGEVLANGFFILLLLTLAALMASRISYPSIVWLFSRWWANLLYMAYLFVTLIVLQLSFFHVWFLFNSGYVGLAVVRAGYRAIDE